MKYARERTIIGAMQQVPCGIGIPNYKDYEARLRAGGYKK